MNRIFPFSSIIEDFISVEPPFEQHKNFIEFEFNKKQVMNFEDFKQELRVSLGVLEFLDQEIGRHDSGNVSVNTDSIIPLLLNDRKIILQRIQARLTEFIFACEAQENSLTRPILAEIFGIATPDDIEIVHADDVGNIDADIADDENVQEEQYDFRKCFLVGMILAWILLAIIEF